MNRILPIIAEMGDTIKNVVAQQHNYASGIYQTEMMKPVIMVETALQIVRDSMGYDGVEIIRRYEDVTAVPVQKTKMIHTLINIIKNGMESMIHSEVSRPVLEVEIANNGDMARMEVRDNGGGIPEENISKIFCHGFTTKKKGHGFGLHSCANAIGDMGGTIAVESDGPGKGAAFIIHLPITRSEVA
jgi:C4-dicarboxylate-specific signal transduction histidine kinase